MHLLIGPTDGWRRAPADPHRGGWPPAHIETGFHTKVPFIVFLNQTNLPQALVPESFFVSSPPPPLYFSLSLFLPISLIRVSRGQRSGAGVRGHPISTQGTVDG